MGLSDRLKIERERDDYQQRRTVFDVDGALAEERVDRIRKLFREAEDRQALEGAEGSKQVGLADVLLRNGPPSRVSTVPEPGPISLEERLGYWQRQLRLQDWEIEVEWATYHELGNNKSGLTWENRDSKEARIKILHLEESPPPSTVWGNWDRELVLVHELLHLHLLAWKGADAEGDPGHTEKEQAIELIATALVRLSRGQVR